MSAANDGAETDSTRIAVARSLSFIAVPMFSPLIPEQIISFAFRFRPDLSRIALSLAQPARAR
jgi:hypothetical protein